MGQVRVGLSGWVYPHWRGRFYPPGLPAAAWLGFVASRFSTVEVNATFYRLQRPETFTRWRREAGPDFLFAVKGSRFVTHMVKLAGGTAPLANFFAQGVLRLGAQLGPILWQLPEMVRFDRERAARFFEALPRDLAQAERLARRRDARLAGRSALTAPDGRSRPLRHALEVRHPSWLEDAALALVEDAGVGLVVADTGGRFPAAEHPTAPFVYVRLHGPAQLYASRYDDAALARWAGRIEAWAARRDVYVYFDNDYQAHAPSDAMRLLHALAHRHRPVGAPATW